MKLQPGRRYPLGASFDGAGTNFSLFSELADRVELCLFDDAGKETRVDLPEVTGFVWHGYAPGIAPGQRYGFRVHGPDNPAAGKRCNREKLRGTYAGLAWPPAIEYFKQLGISALEIQPIHQFVHAQHLLDKGLRNYWGYDSISFFAPHNEYAAYGARGNQVPEFKWMVK